MSELNPKNILIICLDSIGAAYQAVQLVDADVDILEVFPLGTQGHVMLVSEASLDPLLDKIVAKLKSQIISSTSIDTCPAKVIRAYLSVENAELEDHVLIAEGCYVGEIMSAAASAVESGLKLMDLRMLRGASSASYMFLTGDELTLQNFLENSKLKVTLIKNANRHIRGLFNI